SPRGSGGGVGTSISPATNALSAEIGGAAACTPSIGVPSSTAPVTASVSAAASASSDATAAATLVTIQSSLGGGVRPRSVHASPAGREDRPAGGGGATGERSIV